MTGFESVLPQLRRFASSRIAKPVRAREPLPGLLLGTWLVAGVIAAYMLWLPLHNHAVQHWPSVGLLAGLTIVTSFFWIRMANGHDYTCSDLFFAVAISTLPFADATVVTLALIVFLFINARSWEESLNLGIAFNATCGMYAAQWVLHHSPFSLALTTVLAVIASFVGMRIADIPLWSVEAWAASDQAPKRRAIETWREVRDSMLFSFEQFPLNVAMSTLGALSMLAAPWAALCLFVPYLSYWRDTRKTLQLEEERKLARVDKLTGLYNRAGFFEMADEEIHLARRLGYSLTLIMGDLDDFKTVNDTLGHLVGDEVLVRTSIALKSIAKDKHLVGRYGGEEFAIVLNHLDPEKALFVAQQVCSAVRDALSEYGSSISLGMARLEEGDRLETLIGRADKALYSAKYAGKDCVHVYGTDTGEAPKQSDAA